MGVNRALCGEPNLPLLKKWRQNIQSEDSGDRDIVHVYMMQVTHRELRSSGKGA